MKRPVLCIACLFIFLFAFAAAASADDLTYRKLKDGSGYEISSCSASVKTVLIPAEHNGLPVVSIAGKAFVDCPNLTAFSVEKGQSVFYAVDGVLFVKKPVKTLVRFPNAYQKNAYQVPKGVKAIGPWAFAGQHTLRALHIPEGVESFGDYMFASVGSQIAVYVPDSLKKIGKHLFQDQQSNVPFFGSAKSKAYKYAQSNNVPYGIVRKTKPDKQTVKLAKPDLKNAEGIPEPDPGSFWPVPLESVHNYDFNISYTQTLTGFQKKHSDLLIALDSVWDEITPDAEGKTSARLDARTGLYGIGTTASETVLRGYGRDGTLVGTRVVNGDFTFSLPGAYSLGVSGGSETSLRILPYEPVTLAGSGILPLSPDNLHYDQDGNAIQYFVCPFPYSSVSFSMPNYMNIFSYAFWDVNNESAESSPRYSILCLSLQDPYLIPECSQISLSFDHLEILYQNKSFTCAASSRYKLKKDYGKKVYNILKNVKSVMKGVYWPEKLKINHITVRVNGRYPSSFDSVIQLDDFFAKFSKRDIVSFAHEMVHAVDQTLGYNLPGCWLEGRAEYISRKVCDRMKTGYDKYQSRYNWKFLSDRDKDDFFRYYYESVNVETTYPVGYYFIRYLCDTYGENITAQITQNIADEIKANENYRWSLPADVFKSCVTRATDPDVFQHFVRDVINKK